MIKSQAAEGTVLAWIDDEDTLHLMDTESALGILDELYTEWPGGLDEVYAEIESKNKAMGEAEALIDSKNNIIKRMRERLMEHGYNIGEIYNIMYEK